MFVHNGRSLFSRVKKLAFLHGNAILIYNKFNECLICKYRQFSWLLFLSPQNQFVVWWYKNRTSAINSARISSLDIIEWNYCSFYIQSLNALIIMCFFPFFFCCINTSLCQSQTFFGQYTVLLHWCGCRALESQNINKIYL